MNNNFYQTPFPMPEIIPPSFPDKEYSLLNFGGIGDGLIDNTEAFKKTIAACSKRGGGTVTVPEGIWLTGPIHLRSNVQLRIEKNAVVKFSNQFHDYLPVVFTRWEGVECYNYSPLIYAANCENIAITGEGTLEGNGETWWLWKKLQQTAAKKLYDAEANRIPPEERIFGTEVDALRPQFIQPINSRNILIEGITVKNGPMWTIHPVYCRDLIIRQVKILTAGPNTDGINPDSCHNVLIEDCYFETGDDCIAINSGMNEDGWRVNQPCENIVIRNCEFRKGHGGVVIGSGMSGGVGNVYAHHCRCSGCQRGIRLKSMRGRGGAVEDVWVEAFEINNTRRDLVQITTYYEATTVQPLTDTPPIFRNINLKNLRGAGAPIALVVSGLPEEPLHDLTFEDIEFSAEQGFLCQDVDGLTIKNVNIEARTKPRISLTNVNRSEIINSEIE